MNRLDFFIRRLTAQRDCLRLAADLIGGLDGPVLEVGLGKGRTYDFLRDVLPNRQIYAFDRSIGSYPDCTPDIDHMILGDFRETLLGAIEHIGAPAVLAHCDFGSENRQQDSALAEWLGPAIDRLMAPGGVIATDREMTVKGWQPIDVPEGVGPGTYFLYRAAGRT